MKNKQRLWMLIMVICLLFAGLPGYAEDTGVIKALTCNSQSRTVSFTVDFGDNTAVESILVSITQKDWDQADDTAAQNVAAFAEIQGENGIFSGTLKFGYVKSGWYDFTVSDIKAVNGEETVPLQERRKQFYYADQDTVEQAIQAFQDSTVDTIAQVIQTYAVVMGIPDAPQYTASMAKAFISIKNTQYNQFSDSQNAFADIVAALEKTAAVEGILTENDLKQAVLQYGATLGIELDSELDFADVAQIFSGMKEEILTSVDVVQALRENLRIAAGLTALNHANRESASAVLEQYNDVFKLDLSGKYASNKVDVNKGIVGKNFLTVVQLRETFAKRLDEIGKKNPPENGNGSYTPSKSNTIYTVPALNQPEPTPTSKPESVSVFSDLDNVQWAKESVLALHEQGIIAGYADGTFRPSAAIRREEFVKMLVTAFVGQAENAVLEFQDVDQDAWYYPYIAAAVQAGIVSGIEDDVFGIGLEISRQDAAVMLYRILQRPAAAEAEKFADDREIAGYAQEAVYAMREANIINGVGDNLFQPRSPITRAEASRIIYESLRSMKNE